MRETYRVFGAALALGEFTIPALAKFGEVNVETAGTVVERHPDLFTRLQESEATGGRGRPARKYRLTDRQRELVRERLEMQYKDLVHLPKLPTRAVRGPVPPGLIVAEEVFLRDLPAATDAAQRHELMRLGLSALRSGLLEAEQLLDRLDDPRERSTLDAHLFAAEVLRSLHEENSAAGGPYAALFFDAKLAKLAERFTEIDDSPRANLVLKLRTSQAALVPTIDTCLVVDAIPEPEWDEVTSMVLDTMKTLVPHVEYRKAAAVASCISDGYSLASADPAGSCLVLTYDSEKSQGFYPLIVEASARYGSSLLIVDAHFDPAIRQHVTTSHGYYVPHCQGMSQPEIMSYIKRHAPLEVGRGLVFR
jgi:hypothetical protein